MSVHSASPVGIGWSAIVALSEYISVCGEEEKMKAFSFSLSLFQPPSLFLSHAHTLPLALSLSRLLSFAAQPPLVQRVLDSGLATAHRNRTCSNKGRRDGRLSTDQQGVQLKRKKEIANMYKSRPFPIKTQDH